MKQKRRAPDIYDNEQIAEIMHPGSDEWVRLVTNSLYELNR